MRILFVFICIYNFLFAIEQKEFMLNNIKSLIQKEEYLSLAINKYILQTGTIPKNGTSLDWDKLMTDEYLGINFDKTNPYTNKGLVVSFTNNHILIKGLIEKTTDYKNEHKYLYNLYTDSKFRVNTIAPKTSQSADILLGTQILYGDLQKEIAKILFDSKKIFLENATCDKDEYFYELANQKLTYKYCKSDGTKLTVYQDPPIYLNNFEDLKIVKANIGDTAFVEKDTEILEYYFHSEQVNDNYWVKVQKPNIEKLPTTLEDYKNKILTYIPNAKDIYIRQSIGCYLANGDIYCWGKNDYKKAGIENYGQLDTTLKPDYINTPIMLKTQIDNPIENTVTYDIKSKNWYNSPFRVKFDKIGVNSTNVCGITKIFSYTDAGVNYKTGGDLYCNGLINQLYFENISAGIIDTSILSKNKYFGWGKSDKKDDSEKTIKISEDGGPVELDAGVEKTITRDEIYLTDIAVVEDAIAILDDKGKIYTIGKNYKGALGVDKTDYFYYTSTPLQVAGTSTIIFKKIFALRDSRTFGAIDSNNQFYIWGDRGTSIITKPTLLSNTKFNPDAIFVNTNEFILKGTDGVFHKTNGSVTTPVSSTIISGSPLSLSYYKDNTGKEYWLYIDENQQLKGTESLLTCKKQDGTVCNTTTEAPLFKQSLDKLNTPTTTNKIDYSKFTNVSIFKLDHQISEIVENFEDQRPQDKWSKYILAYGNKDVGGFLGMFSSYSRFLGLVDKYDGTSRNFDFGKDNANQDITITFDFYEIGSWFGEEFKVLGNGTELFKQKYQTDLKYPSSNDGGSAIELNCTIPNGKYYNLYINQNEKHPIQIKTKLDNDGKLILKFTSTLGSVNTAILNQYWGIDNLKIVKDSNQKILNFEDFNRINNNGWKKHIITYGGEKVGNILGMFPGYDVYSNNNLYDTTGRANNGPYDGTSKTFDFGVTNKDKRVTVSLDVYEIDNWPDRRTNTFFIFANERREIAVNWFSDISNSLLDNIKGSSPKGTGAYYQDEKHFITFDTTLDSSGKLTLSFISNLDGILLDNSWAIDNLEIKLKDNPYTLLAFDNFDFSDTFNFNQYPITSIQDNGDKTQVPATTFLGPFPTNSPCSGNPCSNESPFILTKTYSFPGYGNYEVDIEFDFYEINTWDGERFEFYANDTLLAVDHFVMDGQQYLRDSNITGINLQDNIDPLTQYVSDQSYKYKLRTKLNSNGDIVLKFRTSLEFNDPTYTNYWSKFDEGIANESWGIDNIKVKLKETDKTFVCTMTGVEQNSQMYCWGNVARSLPILNTSLYDSDKITNLNKLFFTQSQDINKQMSFDAYDQSKNGMLFLKYPTYINGFDYPFYFK